MTEMERIAIEKLSQDMKDMKQWVLNSHQIDWARMHLNNKKLRYLKRYFARILEVLNRFDLERMKLLESEIAKCVELLEELNFY